jgi:CTP:molybdopterin cytidylyltransferase MocA
LRIAAVIFEGGAPRHAVVRELTRVRHGVVLDTIAKLSAAPRVDEIILCTNYPQLAEEAAALGARVVADLSPFHFGRALQKIVREAQCDGIIYLGGAAAPLLSVAEFDQLAEGLRARAPVVITNNPQSADIVAFAPADALLALSPPENDNALATLLKTGGLTREFMPHSVGVHFDLDTPNDALVLSLSPHTGERTQAALRELAWDSTRLTQAITRMRATHCECALIGRVSPAVMAHLNRHTFLRLRVFSEERGMKALDREAQGLVVSLLGYYLAAVGPRRFFADLSQTADVAFIDTRVLFAHFKLKLSEDVRFLSDLGRYEEISHPWLREFTQAAAEADIPVVLGGHSLVSGCMWVVAEHLACRNENS